MFKIYEDDPCDNILPFEGSNIFLNNDPSLNSQFNSDLSLPFVDLENEKNKENDFNLEKFNQTFLNIFEDKTTNFETRKNDNHCSLKNNNPNNLNIKEPKIYSFEDIIKILTENSLSNIISLLTKDETIEKYESNMKLLNKKRKRNRTKNKENENEVVYKRGRKKIDDETDRKHGKYAPDNIIKKIKSKLFEKMINFINSIVNKNNEESKRKLFKKLDYKYINQMKQELDLKLLNSPLKDLLLKDISSKYSNLPSNSNRVNLEKILESEKNDEAIMFVINLSFREFIELFCLKKNLKDIESSNKIVSNITQRIKKNLPRVDSLLDDILEKNDKKYLSYFIFHLYNYEQWFSTKNGRNSKKSERELDV